MTTPQPGLPARYEDTCPRCNELITPGARIVFQRGRPIHVRCHSGGEEE